MKNTFPEMLAYINAAIVNAHLPMPKVKPARARGNPTGKYYKPNGARECARRVRQIAKGMIEPWYYV
jgi:hypothetical protein